MATRPVHLCLHYASAGATDAPLTVSRDALRALVNGQRAAGREAASLAAYGAGGTVGPDRFTLSFDDAHASVLEHALPVLRELGVTATLFVPTAYVGTSDAFVDWDGVRALHAAGWSIGSHAETHGRMAWRYVGEDRAAHEQRLVGELARSRASIEREIGAAPALFAYPYGEAPDVARRAAARAGFAAAFTVAGDGPWDGDRFAIPRTDVDEIVRPCAALGPIGISVVVPACDRVRILADVVTRVASQTYPRDRCELIVVDDGSREDLSPVVRDMPGNVRLVRQGDATFRAGQARQRGADEARFDHLAFLDADVVVGPDFLWHLDWAHRHTPDAVVLGYLSGYNLHDAGGVHTPDVVLDRDVSTLPIIPDRSREPALRSCLDNLSWLAEPWQLTYTGNLSVPKALLARAGGFADAFTGWGLEDIDLGVRLHHAGGRFVFARFAVGHHVVDPSEGPGRNPFRTWPPTRQAFEGYERNLDVLSRLHADDPAVARFVARSRADIEETCSRPTTVGIETGGAASLRTPYHRRLHRVQPGGAPKDELLDRVAYAKKVGAKTILARRRARGAPGVRRGRRRRARRRVLGLDAERRIPVRPRRHRGPARARHRRRGRARARARSGDVRAAARSRHVRGLRAGPRADRRGGGAHRAPRRIGRELRPARAHARRARAAHDPD